MMHVINLQKKRFIPPFSESYTNVLCRASGDLDPRLGEESARAKHEDNVEHGVDRILKDMTDRFWR